MGGKIKKGSRIFYILSEQERSFRFASCDISQNSKNIFSDPTKLCGIKQNQVFSSDMVRKVDFISVSVDQFTSLGTGIIPFLEHDDANRALMASNMQRQSLSLLEKEMAFIETGREYLVARESESTSITKRSGRVIFSSKNKIVVEELFKPQKFFNNSIFLPKINGNIYEEFGDRNIKVFRTTYLLDSSKSSHHSVFLRKNSIVQKGDWVKAGQIIADGMGTLRGNLSFGKNILIGYLGWEGYNFEDAVIISDRLVNEDVFTSLHVKKYKTFFMIGGEKDV